MQIELKNRERSHVEMFWEKTQCKEIQKMFPSTVESKEEAILLYEKSLTPDSTSYGKVIYVDKNYVGDVWCFGIDEEEEKMAMLSIGIFEMKSHGKGIGTSCVQEFSKEIFQRYKIEKLGAFVYSDNIPSLKMLKKADFIEVEEFLEDGRWSKYLERKRNDEGSGENHDESHDESHDKNHDKNSDESSDGGCVIEKIKPKKDLGKLTPEELGKLFPIFLTGHDPAWKEAYETEEQQILGIIEKEAVYRLQHIGSTSVSGLYAKPTIDILMEIHVSVDTEKFIETIKSLGYLYNHQPGSPAPHMMFMKGYTEEGFQGQAVHLHVRYPGDWNELYFRDYLMEHPEVSRAYEDLKKKLKNEFEFDREGYTSAKTDFIKKITEAARAAYGNRYEIK